MPGLVLLDLQPHSTVSARYGSDRDAKPRQAASSSRVVAGMIALVGRPGPSRGASPGGERAGGRSTLSLDRSSRAAERRPPPRRGLALRRVARRGWRLTGIGPGEMLRRLDANGRGRARSGPNPSPRQVVRVMFPIRSSIRGSVVAFVMAFTIMSAFAMPAGAGSVTNAEVSVGSPHDLAPRSHQNEPRAGRHGIATRLRCATAQWARSAGFRGTTRQA